MKWTKANCSSCILTILAIVFIFSNPAFGQESVLKSEGPLDEIFIFRAVLSGLLTILIWVARGADKRLRELEEFSQQAKEKRVDGMARLVELENKWKIITHEQKELVSLIGMQRELMLTKYLDKDATEKHWTIVEGTLKDHSSILRTISVQLEAAQQRKDGEERRRM